MASNYSVPITFKILGVEDLQRANAELKKMGGGGTNSPIAKATKGTKNFGFAAQNAGYQVQDFIVQVQGGQDPLRALGQQLPQLTVGMGLWGAAIGVVAASLPALIGLMMDTEEESVALSDSISAVEESLGNLSKVSQSLDFSAWNESWNKATQAVKEAKLELLEFELVAAEAEMGRVLKSLSSEVIGTASAWQELKGAVADFVFGAEGAADVMADIDLAESMGINRSTVDQMQALVMAFDAGTISLEELSSGMTELGIDTANAEGEFYDLIRAMQAAKKAQDDLAAGRAQAGAAGGSLATGGMLSEGGAGTVEQLKEIEVIAERMIDPIVAARIAANDLLQAGREGWPALTEEVETAGESFINFGTVVTAFDQSFQGMLTGVLQGTQSLQDGIKDMAKVVIAELLRILALQALTGVGGTIGTAAGNILGSAKGNVFDGGQHVTAYAKGGVVNSPTLFPMANGAGLMGEAGPEAVMPLTRMPDGKLGVASGGMNVTVNNNAPGAEIRTGSDGNGGLTIDVIMKSVAAAVSRGGNPVADSLERSYALNRGKALY